MKISISQQTKAIEDLIKFKQERPELPIVSMVDGEIVFDDYAYCLGAFGGVELGEIASYGEKIYTDRDSFMEDYYGFNDDWICEDFNYKPFISEFTYKQGKCTKEEFEANNEASKKVDKYLEEVADRYFREAIIMYIEQPDYDIQNQLKIID